jgi:glycosyltransferase XagB
VALRSAMEYYFYFRSRLHAQAIRGFIPLGGNTVFVKRRLLNEVGGWDVDCLAEDCELGVRLSTLKHHVSVAFDPGLTTLEEAPVTAKAWVKQRTRWNLGFLQVYRKGMWRQLPTLRRQVLARWTLTQPFSMAVAGVMIPTAILMALLLSPPLWVTMVAFLPAFPTLLIVAMENVALYEYSVEFQRRVRLRDYVKLTLTTPVYQLLAGWSALQASGKYLKGDFRWVKTAHAGRALHVLETSTVRQSRPADLSAFAAPDLPDQSRAPAQ